jgi:pimeloyl-ACP methyl ester carboxylesterase
LGGDERAVLIGHDWGAAAAYGAVALPDQPWRAMAALAIPPPASLGRPPRSAGEVRLAARQLILSSYMLYQQFPVISERSLQWLIPFLWRRWSPGYDGRDDARRVLESLDTPARKAAALRYYRALLPWNRLPEYATEQAAMRARQRCPVLVLHGVDDGCLQVAYSEGGEALLPAGSEVALIAGAGHFLQLERPEEINTRIAAFLR